MPEHLEHPVTDVQYWEAVASLRGCRFYHLGRTRQRADCIGIAFVAAWACGLPVTDFRAYERMPDADVLRRAVAARCELRQWAEWRLVGRLLVLRPSPDLVPQLAESPPIHFGIMGPDGAMAEMGARFTTSRPKPEHVESCWLVRGVRPTVSLA